MFVDTGTYQRWFFGHLGKIVSMNEKKTHCSVEWVQPVKYHGSHTSKSSFPVGYFKGVEDEEVRL